jgi:hypothetical protein
MATNVPGDQGPGNPASDLFGAAPGVPAQAILGTAAQQEKMIERDRPQPPIPRKALVTAWADAIKHAKKHWKPAFQRMREDQADRAKTAGIRGEAARRAR